MAATALLQYAPFSSAADPSFWHALANHKLNDLKLSDSAIPIHGFYTVGDRQDVPPRASVGTESFDKTLSPNVTRFQIHGSLHNTNTIDAFRKLDPLTAVDEDVQKLWRDMQRGAVLDNPSLLTRFTLMTFSDLKKYHFYYWFGFPAVGLETDFLATPAQSLSSVLSNENASTLFATLNSLGGEGGHSRHAFVVTHDDDDKINTTQLSQWQSKFSNDTSKFAVAVADPCGLNENPGWPVRNLLVALSYHFAQTEDVVVRIMALRRTLERSITFDVTVPAMSTEARNAAGPPKSVKGLEKDKKKRLKPQKCDLSASMDPLRLATTAVGLNLSLMRWRLMPDIDLAKVAGTKCLLLGAGTLGCNVGRLLLGWGVKKITFVDSGTVSYSNPVRQTLFTFEDSAQSKPKAETAAFRLSQVFPGVEAEGHSLSIPMPGHPVSGTSEEQAKMNTAELEALIDAHDAVFLLMDTRESRWLPALMCAAKDKMCITAAVGFDSYVAMRHGGLLEDGTRNVGCYFCNDVVAPTNSTTDRTLDQQCTVSRPGVSMVVSGVAVEILVAMLHHPDANRASAKEEPNGEGSCLGAVPHQIRGYLSDFNQMSVTGGSFDRCTACSQTVIKSFQERGFDLVLDAMNTPKFLEDLTGLSEMHKQVDDLDFDWDDDDDDDDDEFNEE